MDRNEAIEIVREYYYPSSGKDLNEALETLIPELKESEDERIRKSIIKSITDLRAECIEIYGVKKEDILAWLEKQGEQNPKSADFIPTDCTSDAKNENRWHKVEDSLPDDAREVLCKDAIGNFFIGRYYNDGDYWEVSMYDEPNKSNKDNPSVIMWANIPSCEQNLANSAKTCKVKPKFKVGDWVVNEFGHLKHITNIKNDCYYAEGEDVEWHGTFEYGDTHFRLWTIQDAKDGDVLYTSSTASNETFIFKGLTTEGYIECYCSYDSEDKYCEGKYHFIGKPTFTTHPATKKQRDLLFQKMKEAGYEWDAENKELKKIEQPKLTKFEDAIKDMLDVYRNAIDENDATVEEVKEHAAYLLSLIPQQPAWSEEDDINLGKAIWYVENPAPMVVKDSMLVEWLKSIKERVQPKQDLHPRYIEGKGIYVPIIDVVLNMQDEPEEMTWDKAKDIALSKEQMLVVLYYKDEINALFEKYGGQKLKGWHWTSTQYSGATYAWYVGFDPSYVYSTTRTNGLSVRAFSAYHPES